MYRKTWAEIDTEVLEKNAREITEKYKDYSYHIGVVKAGAYGHGFGAIHALIRGGINYLAVATPEEALAVREENRSIPVLILEPYIRRPEVVEIALKNDLTLTVDSLADAARLAGTPLPSPLKVHLKLDCGMNRLGIKRKEEVEEAVSLLSGKENLILEGIFTHFATGGILDPYYDKSLATFRHLTEGIDLKKIPIVHINRSITLVHHEKLEFETGTRHGILLYGFSQSIPEPKGLRRLKRLLTLKRLGISPCILENDLKLETAFSLFGEVISIREVKKGERIGYGAQGVAPEDQRIATLSIGYHDGVDSSLGEVFIGQKRYPIVGSACMDMITILVDGSVSVGDVAELFGKNISVSQAARKSGVNAYRLLTGIGPRVPRVYTNTK